MKKKKNKVPLDMLEHKMYSFIKFVECLAYQSQLPQKGLHLLN